MVRHPSPIDQPLPPPFVRTIKKIRKTTHRFEKTAQRKERKTEAMTHPRTHVPSSISPHPKEKRNNPTNLSALEKFTAAAPLIVLSWSSWLPSWPWTSPPAPHSHLHEDHLFSVSIPSTPLDSNLISPEKLHSTRPWRRWPAARSLAFSLLSPVPPPPSIHLLQDVFRGRQLP